MKRSTKTTKKLLFEQIDLQMSYEGGHGKMGRVFLIIDLRNNVILAFLKFLFGRLF